MWLNYLRRKLLDWLTGKPGKEQANKIKEIISNSPPPQIQIRTIQDARAAVEIKTFRDVRAFCEEVRKTLTIYKNSCEKMRDTSWVHKKAIDSLYVEVGNLADKIDRLIISEQQQSSPVGE